MLNNLVTSQTDPNSFTTQIKALQAKISSLQDQLKSVQGKYALCQANLATISAKSGNISVPSTPGDSQIQNSNISSITPIQKDTPYAYAAYAETNIFDYVKNPSKYRGWGTEILVGEVNDFLAAGDRGVLNNYIEIVDDSKSASIPPDKMMVLIRDDSDYTSIVDSLHKGDIIDIWGIGSMSQQFHSVGSSDSTSSYEPVITAQRIDRCMPASCGYGNTILLFDKKI